MRSASTAVTCLLTVLKKDEERYLNNSVATRHGSGLQKGGHVHPEPRGTTCLPKGTGCWGEQSGSQREVMKGKGPELLVLGHSEKPLNG